ncbi:hypothetical protein MTR67_024795 [Solanum verrucosum]|uniref:Fungal lipase-type domain-containing protein n=1 Tax=Solanum verrucosum TaxID=315347 RepID=A0AAF0R2A8_SOLVR|nr:hypothetical protein MTR67_024795 [Solanum verrucosum]
MRLVLPISKCFKLSKLGARRFKITSSWNPGFNHYSVGDREVAELRDKWMEFQGIKNWEGLLDPLDDDLRKEILRYGEFVEAVCRCFDFDMSSPTYATCLYPKSSMLTDCGLDKTGYKVVKNLYGTSVVQMPRWTKKTFPNLASPQSSWIGYVAVCDDDKEISRLGRHDVVIAYRGHSLGAALATLTVYDITTKFSNAPIVSVVSFGGPRVGNKSFRCQLEKSGTNVLRIVNSDDLVTKVPGFVIHDNIDDVAERETTHVASTRMPSWLQKCMEDTQWVYAEVGKELRLSSKDLCPQIINKGNVATCHDLKTYLHLVDNFVKVEHKREKPIDCSG